jgi:uncharacterized membrane-anchored protein
MIKLFNIYDGGRVSVYTEACRTAAFGGSHAQIGLIALTKIVLFSIIRIFVNSFCFILTFFEFSPLWKQLYGLKK